MSFLEDLYRAISQVTGSNWKAPSESNQQQRANQGTPAQNVGGATAPRTQAPPRTVAPTGASGNNRWADFIANLVQAQQESGSGSEASTAQMYDAPVSTPQTKAPSNQEAKKEKSRFDEAVERNIKNINLNELNPFYTPQANALEPESTAEDGDKDKDKDDKQNEEVAPNVTIEGSNDANINKKNYEQQVRDVIGDEAFEKLQQDTKEREKNNREEQASKIKFSPSIETSDVKGNFLTDFADSYANAAFTPSAPDNTVDRTIPTEGAGYPGNTTPWREQFLYDWGYTTPKELVQQGNAGTNIAVGDDVSLQEARQSGALQDAINEELGTNIEEITSEDQKNAKTGNQAEDDNQLYYGFTRDELNQMYEDAIYNAAMADKDYRKLFDEAGYGDYGSYAAYGSLGDTLDYDSRREITRDIFGLDDTQPDLEIQGLKDIYFENGTINDKMTPDEMLDAILEAHWGAENIINPYQWMSDEAYQAANPFNGSTAGEGYANYWLENGVIPVDESGVFGRFEGDWGQLDNEDFAALVAAGNIINQLNAGWRPTDADLAAMSQIYHNGGDLASFAYLPEDGSESEYKGREWTPNRNANAYAMPQLLQAMAAAEGGDYSGLTPYVDSNMALGDAYMTDTIAKAIEDATGKKVGRKDR